MEGHRRRAAPIGGSRAAGILLGLAASCLALASCGEGLGTEVSTSPAELLRLSSATDSVVIGERADPPLGVRVESAAGEPVEGIPVRFLLASGPGDVVQELAVSNEEGIAEAGFQASGEFGASRIRADIPSASNVSPLEFEMVTLPSDEIVLEKNEGDDQKAEVGSQLSVPFALEVSTPQGVPAGGVRVAWEIVEGGESGAYLSADTTFTDAEGRTRTLLTLGSRPGEYAVRAFATGGVITDTTRFEAAALEAAAGPVALDSIGSLPLTPDEEAVIHGQGFGGLPDQIEIRVEGATAEVLEAGPSRIRFRVPSFSDRCLPARDVGVRVLVGGNASNGLMVPQRPGTPFLDLDVGEARVLSGSVPVGCLQIAASGEPRRYRLAVGSAARVAEATTPLRLILKAGSEEQAPSLSSAVERTGERAPLLSRDSRELPGAEVRLRQDALRELRRRRIAERRLTPDQRQTRSVGTEAESVSEGDLMRFAFAVRSGQDAASCEDTVRTIGGRVRALGPRIALVEDTLTAGGFSEEQWGRLRNELEDVVLPTSFEYFGEPADIDRSGRITVLVTPAVNGLTPRGSSNRVGGLFLPLDLASSGDPDGGGLRGPAGEICATSNEAELLYIASPDPAGEFGDPLSTERALRNARVTITHELQHLINAEQRVILGNGDFEDIEEVWLNEGVSHIAEEIVGLRLMEREPAEDIGFDEILRSRDQIDLFNIFHGGNFLRLSLFMQQPNAAPTLAQAEPGGVRTAQYRGFAWAFLRWLGDQESGSSRASLFRAIARGGGAHATGIQNVEQVVGTDWESLLADFSLALSLDGLDVEGASDRHQIAGWNLRSIFAGLHENASTGRSFPLEFPLAAPRLSFDSQTVDIESRASTHAHFVLDSSRGSPALAIRLASQGGGTLGSLDAPQVGIVRTR